MSSNIEVQRICQQCGKEFTARTTVTQYCGDTCAKRAYKAKLKSAKIETSNKETRLIKSKPFEELNAKEFLTVRDVATLLSSSIRTIYRLIEQGNIKAVNLAQRKTLVKRSELDKLFL
jgi:excisionase family DNA binding protein